MRLTFLTGCCLFLFELLPAQQLAAYKAPQFTDSARMQKIRATEPIVRSIYEAYAKANHFPGLTYAVLSEGQVLYSGGTGVTDLQSKTPVTTGSVFRIASMSKSFTAMAILQLRDAGRLKLDEPAAAYIPEMKGLTYLTQDARPITVRDLLTHSAGFPEDNPWGDRQLQDSDAELLQLLKNGTSFSNVPGVQYEYSNLGFALLGRIISNVSGSSYQQYIAERIWKPLGMLHTYWEFTKVPPAALAHGYRWMNENWQEEALLHDGAYGAMGGILTTMEDFTRYMALHLSAWPPRNEPENPVLKRSSLREMHQPWRFNTLNPNYHYPGAANACPLVSAYGYGLRWSSDCQNRTTVGHSGGLPGFGSHWIILPEYGIGIVCFANRTYAPTTPVNMQVMDTVIAIAGLKPRSLPPSSILEQRKQELVRLLPTWEGAQESGIFAENFFPDYTMPALQKEAALLFAKAGKIINIGPLVAENQLRGSFVLQGEKARLQIYFTLTPETPALIQEYRIREVQ